MFEIKLCISQTQHIAVEVILEELGTISISLQDAEDDPVFVEQLGDTPLWKQITMTAYFAETIDINILQQILEQSLGCPLEINARNIEEEDWQKASMQTFEAMQFGDRLWVCPSWRHYPDPFAVNIKLDPGLAFGTGTHATTALCLEWLAEYPIKGKTIVDFGCGSGILAIAAYYLGAASVLAIDHDPQAIQATKSNAKYNLVPESIMNIQIAHQVQQKNCDIIIANVLLQPLIDLQQQFAQCIKPSGKLILSGILESQFDELRQAYQPNFIFEHVSLRDEWLLVEASLH